MATAYGRSGRHLRYLTLITALVCINIWLWVRLLGGAGDTTLLPSEVGLALVSTLIAVGAAYMLWRNPLRRSARMMITPALAQSLATHQAGHIVAAYVTDGLANTPNSLSAPCETGRLQPTITESALRTELTRTLAGIAAEEVFTGESGSHAEPDLAWATELATDMVGRYGMSGSLVSFTPANRGRRRFVESVLEDARARKELEAILREAMRDATRMMLENRHVIIELRAALLQDHQLSATQIRDLIGNADALRHSEDAVLVDLRTAGPRPVAQVSEI